LLVLLKHPLVGSGDVRGRHLALTRRLELDLRRNGPAFPTAAHLAAWAAGAGEEAQLWAECLGRVLTLGVTTCTVTSLVFLPAVLTWLRPAGTDAEAPEELEVAEAAAESEGESAAPTRRAA
jgi:hypothetical protein